MNPASSAAPEVTGAVRLHDWGVIRATGADALSFLQGQLTQDVAKLELGQARLAGFCSAKGRLQATFVAWRHDADQVFLACSADLLPAVLKRLSMFVLRAKCKLSDATAELPLWGEAGGSTPGQAVWSCATLGQADVVRLPDGLFKGQPVPLRLWAGAAPATEHPLDLQTWRGLEASSGVARITAATAEQFVPQMVNLELVGGVSFQKGCFPGQEVVARSQYRGTLKRRAQLVLASAPVQAGQEIFHDADPGQPAGMVVLAGSLPGVGQLALVEVKLAALQSGGLHAGTADGVPLTLATLPYAIPADQA